MRRLSTRARALLVLLCLALVSCERVGALSLRSNGHDLAKRQIPAVLDTTDKTTATDTSTASTKTDTTISTTSSSSSSSTSSTSAAQTTSTTTSSTPTSSSSSTSTTDLTTPTTNQQQQPTATPSTSTDQPQNTPPPTTTQDPQQPTETILSTGTNSDGQTTVVTVFVSGSSSSTTTSASASASTTSSSGGGDGISTSSIVGMSVAGGVALIGVVSFFIWKFTRKRFGDFDDEPIKWPELNMHGENLNYALPTSRAGTGAGAGTGLDSSSEVDLSRNTSGAGYSTSQYATPAAADSAADLYAPGGDPYAVPPLPHLNPSQPYRDDPGTYGPGYYDPYRGPVPQTFNDAASVDSHAPGYAGEAIPMNNLATGGALGAGRRAMSPQPPMAGRQSPSPSLGYGGRASPGPVVAMSGRQSPGPNVAYGGGY